MKGGSQEAKGHKSTGGGRTCYGKGATLTLLPLTSRTHKNAINNYFLSFLDTV